MNRTNHRNNLPNAIAIAIIIDTAIIPKVTIIANASPKFPLLSENLKESMPSMIPKIIIPIGICHQNKAKLIFNFYSPFIILSYYNIFLMYCQNIGSSSENRTLLIFIVSEVVSPET
jgi:hypothetical protein